MKLLLTSSGITNPSIANALFEMVGKLPEETSVAFIPTASNVEPGDKFWVIKDLSNLQKQNFQSIDIVDISALEEKVWRPRLEAVDVLFFEGGNSYHLMEWIDRSGLKKILPELLKSKVYVGVSAGSMVVSRDLALRVGQEIYEEDLDRTEDVDGLGYVDFYVFPHLNSEYFLKVKEDNIRKIMSGSPQKVYVLDDNSALRVEDEKITVVSEGKYFVLP